MKKLLFLVFALCITISVHSQCGVNSFIEDNYTVDASILALREILSDPADPDFSNPFIPPNRLTPYLEQLSAIYDNPNNDPRIDSLFNEFNFHVNDYYNIRINTKRIYVIVTTNLPWVQPLKDTGISGYQELDDLLLTYQLSVEEYYDLPPAGVTIFTFLTSFEFLNMGAIVEEFSLLSEILNASQDNGGFGINYSGVPYFIPGPGGGGNAEVCDILVLSEGNFEFFLAGDDCLSGCLATESRFVSVSQDCQNINFLQTEEFRLSKITLAPNPATHILQVKNNNTPIKLYTIYSAEGKKQKSQTFTNNIDISFLTSGLYFIEFIAENGIKQTEKFIKN